MIEAEKEDSIYRLFIDYNAETLICGVCFSAAPWRLLMETCLWTSPRTLLTMMFFSFFSIWFVCFQSRSLLLKALWCEWSIDFLYNDWYISKGETENCTCFTLPLLCHDQQSTKFINMPWDTAGNVILWLILTLGQGTRGGEIQRCHVCWWKNQLYWRPSSFTHST